METEVLLKEIFGDEPYRKLVEAIRDFGVLQLDSEGRIVSWNAGATALFGYSEAEIIGKPYSSIFTNEDQESDIPERELKEVAETGRAEDMRWHPRRDGTRFYANCVMTALLDEQGSLSGFAKVVRDDTARMQMELALNASEVRYRRLFEAAHDGILILNAETGQIVDVNPFMCELLNYQKAEFMGKELWEIGLFKDKNESQTAFLELQETGYIRYEDMPLETKHGLRREVEFISKVYREDGRQVIQCNIRDITERKAAEESIRFQAHLLDVVEQSVIATDLDGIVIYWNQFAQHLFGWTAQEAIGRQIMELTTPEVMTEEALEIMFHLRQGESWTGEFNVQRRDGTTFQVQIINSPINDDKGKLVGIIGVSNDITERKQAEASLTELTRQLERQARVFNTTLSSITDFAYIFDRDGRFVYANQALLDLWGLTLDDAVGKDFFDLQYPEELASRLQQQIEQVFDTRQGLRDETPYTSPTGVSGYYEYIFTPVMASDGTVEVVAGSTRDISERKQIETAFRESRERLQMAMNAAKIYSWEMNIATQQVEWSNNLERVIGFHLPSDFATVNSLIHPEDREETVQLILQAIRDGQDYESEFRLVNPTSGEIVWLRGQGVLAGDAQNSQQRFVGITQNITERKQAEEELNASEERLRTIFEASRDGILVEANERIVYVNQSYTRLLGYETPEELIGKHVSSVISSEDTERLLKFGKSRVRGNLPSSVYEFKAKRKDGTLIDVEASVSTSAVAGHSYITTIIRDITERKRAEEELKKINEQLEGRVAERTAALSETNAILQEEITERRRIEAERVELLRRVIFAQEEERRRIAREMHDQFGQGLSALTLKLAALKEEFSEQSKLHEQLEILERVANQLDADVDFLVWELRPTVLDDLGLPAALKAHVHNWSKHFDTPAELHVSGMKQVRLTGEIETVLYRIMQEALNNTAKHARAGKVDIILEHRNHHVSLIIEDDGVGFDDAQAFSPNEKGLGLIGMRERAVFVGGTVEIESHPNDGTTVFVRIPIS